VSSEPHEPMVNSAASATATSRMEDPEAIVGGGPFLFPLIE
jgi:hypothetical protein